MTVSIANGAPLDSETLYGAQYAAPRHSRNTGKPAGGLAFDETSLEPQTPGQLRSAMSAQSTPAAIMHPRSSPLPWIIAAVAAVVIWNGMHRKKRGR